MISLLLELRPLLIVSVLTCDVQPLKYPQLTTQAEKQTMMGKSKSTISYFCDFSSYEVV